MRHNSRTAAALASLAALALVIGAARLPAADDGGNSVAGAGSGAGLSGREPRRSSRPARLPRPCWTGRTSRASRSASPQQCRRGHGGGDDVVVDRNGQVRAAVIDFGASWVGNCKVAID
jgi:hypothetical protein